jgi:hypothetical protein
VQVVETDKMNLSQAFQDYFKNAIISVEGYLQLFMQQPKRRKAIVSILGTF